MNECYAKTLREIKITRFRQNIKKGFAIYILIFPLIRKLPKTDFSTLFFEFENSELPLKFSFSEKAKKMCAIVLRTMAHIFVVF